MLARQRHVLDITAGHPRVSGWVTLVGHDLMSDELVVAASALARDEGTGITFHLSPGDGDAVSYLARTGRRPAAHLDALGALGPHVLLAHAVHLDDEEVAVVLDRHVGIAYCPWAYLRLGQGVARAGRHAEIVAAGGRIALGCDSENAGDHVDVLRAAAAAAGIALDAGAPSRSAPTPRWSWPRSAAPRPSAWATRSGRWSRASGPTSSLVDTTAPNWVPLAPDPVLQLVWASDGRDVRHVVASGPGRRPRRALHDRRRRRAGRRRAVRVSAACSPRPASIRGRAGRSRDPSESWRAGPRDVLMPAYSDGTNRQASSALGTAAWQPRVPSTTCVTPTSTATDASE